MRTETNKANCTECGFVAKSEQGLRVHVLRKHRGRRWASTGVLRSGPALTKPRKVRLKAAQPNSGRTINWCPCCGVNLAAVRLAANFNT